MGPGEAVVDREDDGGVREVARVEATHGFIEWEDRVALRPQVLKSPPERIRRDEEVWDPDVFIVEGEAVIAEDPQLAAGDPPSDREEADCLEGMQRGELDASCASH